MSTPNEETTEQLEERLKDCAMLLNKALPHVFKEYIRISEKLQRRKAAATGRFAPDVSRYEAVLDCLGSHGDWMTKRQVYDLLSKAGKITTKAQRGVLNTTVNYHANENHIQWLNREAGDDALIGLNHFPPPKQI